MTLVNTETTGSGQITYEAHKGYAAAGQEKSEAPAIR